jgi:hypothetical protein
VRRITGGLIAFLAFTGTFVVLPVYAAPSSQAKPVSPSIDAVDLGSVEAPEDAAVVTTDGAVVDAGPEAGVTPPETGAPAEPTAPSDDEQVASSGTEIDGVPALTVSRPDTDEFSSVGVTWAEDAGVSGVTVQLRTRNAAGTWTTWTKVEQDDVDPGSTGAAVRGGTAPYWTGAAHGVEVIVQAADGTTPQDVQVQLIDPGTSAADAAPGAPTKVKDQANAAMRMPVIYTRAQWGADETIMGWDAEYAPTLKAATIHHTADSNNYGQADVPAIMRSIYAYHTLSRGWGDIGYNVIVDKFGRAWEGRSGGLQSTVVGAHAGGFNSGTFGVSMLGNFDVAETPPAMIDTVAAVIAWKFSLYGVDPKGTTTLTSGGGGTSKYAAGVPVTLPTIFAHRDVGSTACPGRYAFGHMAEIRSKVAARMADLSLYEPAASWLQTAGGTDTMLYRGNYGDVPLACDWNGDGISSVGLFRKGTFILFDSNQQSAAISKQFSFGNSGDVPLCGDWDGDGVETVGVWRAGVFYLRNSNSAGGQDATLAFGNVTDAPVVGNWDGDAFDTIGVRRGAAYYFANSNLRPTVALSYEFGLASDRMVVGDWDGDGRDSVGVARSSVFYLKTSQPTGAAYDVRYYGNPKDRPVAGRWENTNGEAIGVTRGY